MGLIGDGDGQFFTGIGATPNTVFLVALQYHRIAEDIGELNVRRRVADTAQQHHSNEQAEVVGAVPERVHHGRQCLV